MAIVKVLEKEHEKEIRFKLGRIPIPTLKESVWCVARSLQCIGTIEIVDITK